MVTIREERIADVAARESLLDKAYGTARFAKTSERLREGRLPAAGLSLVATERGRLVGTVNIPDVTQDDVLEMIILGKMPKQPKAA